MSTKQAGESKFQLVLFSVLTLGILALAGALLATNLPNAQASATHSQVAEDKAKSASYSEDIELSEIRHAERSVNNLKH